MRNRSLFVFSSLVFLSVFFTSNSKAQEYAIGADLSFIKQAEDSGFVFKDIDGKAKKGLDIFKNHGYNWIRLRLFHSPTELPNNLVYTLKLAKEAKEKGYKFLLDYHYSDTWADPSKQYLPKVWEGLSQEVLIDSLYQYTKRTMLAFKDSEVYPDMVQIGNEISNGMCWPNGKLPENWDNLAALLQAGINGVFASAGNKKPPKIMIHIDKGGDWQFTKYWYDKLNTFNVDFDVIGQSYYPWWHGNLLQLRECLNNTVLLYKKEIILVETAYNYEVAEYADKLPPFSETPEGQKEFVEDVHQIILQIPNSLGTGIFWWEAAAPNKAFSYRTYFTNDGLPQPVLTVFDKYVRN